MKKLLFIVGLMMTANLVFGGGIVTNTNQSAAWVRMLVRDASTEIDAAFFNPAGLTQLPDGFHLSISNQTIGQTMTIENSGLNKTAEGKVFAPVFPNLYAAYKTGNFAFSLGFMPIGGGGSASYDEGVPMIELPVAGAISKLNKAPGVDISGYSMNASLSGTSVYFGIQAGVSYAISDAISVYGGARYVIVKNSYTGHVKDVKFTTGSGDVLASQFMTNMAQQAQKYSALAQTTAKQMQPLIDGGAGKLTFVQAEGAKILPKEVRQQLEMGLQHLGQNSATISNLTLEQAQGIYAMASKELGKQAVEAEVGARLLSDQELDTKQSGGGITPIVGLNLNLLEGKLNIGAKYEFPTKIDITNETTEGKGFTVGITPEGKAIEMFQDGMSTSADMPAFLSVGVQYKVTDKFTTHLGYHLYFDKNLIWAEDMGVNLIDNNLWEAGLGLEYQLSEKLLLSAGYVRGKTGVNENFQNDMRYSLTSDTYGFGGAYKINDMLKLQAGGFYVKYYEDTVGLQTYGKSNFCFAVGLDIALLRNKTVD